MTKSPPPARYPPQWDATLAIVCVTLSFVAINALGVFEVFNGLILDSCSGLCMKGWGSIPELVGWWSALAVAIVGTVWSSRLRSRHHRVSWRIAALTFAAAVVIMAVSIVLSLAVNQ